VITYTLAAIGAGIVLALGVPMMERFLRWARPLSPRQEEAEHFRQQAHRSLDRFIR
jgi:hypothetical protein